MEEAILYANSSLEVRLSILKITFIFICSYLLNYKIINKKINYKFILNIIMISFLSIFCAIIRYKINYVISLLFWIILATLIFDKSNIKQSMVVTISSLSINYIISFFSVAIDFIINIIIGLKNNTINLVIILCIHLIILKSIFRINKFKYGIISLRSDKANEYIDVLILTISAIVIFSGIVLINYNILIVENMMIGFIAFAFIIGIIIQKSLQLYYKQKMLIKDLNETKEELENKKKEVEELEAENIRISKKNHTIVHKQKSIEHKLEEMLMKTEMSVEESAEVKERLEKLHTQIYSEKENTNLDKTGINNIDDMLDYMQSECIKNKIEFTLVIKGNIHYMVNNLISKEDLETLLADHIKDAIIAINHTDNINRSILVKLGNIDGIYSLYIYDSGVEFKKEVLENLGMKPFTTYKDEGGTGMGFMNTFDTLRKCKASLIIEEFNEPKPDNYTKLIAIKFDNNNEFEIKSYRKIEIKKKI